MSTSSIVVVWSSIARASETVRLGRFSSSRISAPLLKLTMPKRWTKIVFGPIPRIMSRTDSSNPRMSAVMPTMEVMPMTTPRTVSAECSLLVRTESNAMTMTSPCEAEPDSHTTCQPSNHGRAARLERGAVREPPRGAVQEPPLLVPQRVDRIEPGGLEGRIHAEENAHRGREAEADGERPPGERDGEAGREV